MLLIRTHQRTNPTASSDATPNHSEPPTDHAEPDVVQTVRTWHAEGRSQRVIARDLKIDRRKVKRIIDS
jgi:DNA-binding transcriptional regulator LsrR (DeoR family)